MSTRSRFAYSVQPGRPCGSARLIGSAVDVKPVIASTNAKVGMPVLLARKVEPISGQLVTASELKPPLPVQPVPSATACGAHEDTTRPRRLLATPLVLSILKNEDSYGYAIIQQVRELSDGEMQWADGMLYPILHRLEKQGWRKRALNVPVY